ncbi:YSIRK-type signal peptide-containing protein, partial [uncultured Gemella sp.]|uniref:YSIRK-type signal peptide-containing protein n=1 Tax=uncultured Gemella sp. TaxID=254352 RepID=UPI0028D1A576
MIGKNNKKKFHELSGEKLETYSIKKFKVGAASVLIGVGLFFGAGVVEASDNGTQAREATNNSDEGVNNSNTILENSVKPVANKIVNSPEKVAAAVAEKLATQSGENSQVESTTKEVDKSLLNKKIEELKAQLERIKNNSKRQSMIDDATSKLASAESLAQSSATQTEVDAKAKEISSLTSILKSIKAEETPKENKNQDSRNGKKMKEGTGFRTGVTAQALTGSIHFDTSTGPTEKQIPVANNGDGERVINMAISYSASSTETVTDGKVRVTIPKEFLHSTKKPEFANSSFVKSVDDLSTATNYIYDLNLNPMSGGTVAESLLKLYVGTSIKNAPSKGDVLSVNTDFIAGGETLSTKSARASFDYLSEILYREKEWRPKTVKYMVDQFGAPLPEFKMGSVSNGTFKPIEGNTFRLPFIMSDQSFFNNEETNQNGNGRLTSYDYTISGIPDFLELDPTNIKNNKFWTLENGVLTLHPDENKGIDQSLLYGGPILKVKEGAFNTPEAIERAIESNSTKGFNANIVYKAVGHRPDGSTFTQTLDNPDGFRLYLGDGIPAIKEMDTRIFPETNQRLYSHASNEDKFNARFSIPNDKLKGDGAFLPSQYINYFIPKDQEGNYFTKFQLNRVFTNEIKADGSREFRGYYREKLEGNLKENFKLYGVTKDNQAELLKEYTSIDELYNTIEINPEKKYDHLILKHPGIVDEFQRYNSTSKTITGLEARLGVTVGTWKEKAQDSTIQRYRDEIAQGSTSENTIESAIAMERPATGSGEVAEHIKTPTKLTLNMNQIGSQTLTKDDLTRGRTIPIAVTYSAEDYFRLIESDNDGSETYDINKLDPNITKTSVMLLADPKLPLKDFRLAADNRLLSKYTLHFGGTNGDAAKESYDKLKESYDTVNPTNIIENYKGTGKRAYIFDSKDLNLTGYDLNRWIKGGLYSPTALTFEVENNGQVEAGTYGIESYLVWNSESETLIGNDNSINANFVENHAPGLSISKATINVTINNIAEYSASLTIAKPGTTGVRGIIDVKNGQEVILSPQIENLTDLPQKVKEAVVLIPKTEALTYLEGPIVDDSDEYDVFYTTSTAADKTTGTYVSAAQITNWKDVTAVKYVFKNNYTVTKEHGFKHNFNLRVDQNNPNYVKSTSQIFLKNGQDVWLESNVVGLRTEDTRGKLEVYYKTVDGELLKEFPKTRDFEGQPYATTKEPILKGFVNRWYAVNDYIFIEVQPDSAPEIGTYERQVTKKVTYLYDKAKVKVETKDITRTINYIEKNNEGNIISNPVIQKVTVSRKVYTGEKTGRVVEDNWEIPANAKWESVTSPTPSEWEKPEVKVNDQYIAKEAIDEVRITPEVLNNGNIVENVYYERFVPGGNVIAKYVIKGTTTELKASTNVSTGAQVGSEYTATAPQAGEVLKQGELEYVLEGRKADSAAETGKVTADTQEIIYEYVPKQGGNVIAKYVIKGTTTELKASTNVSTGAQVGSEYTATAPQAGEVLKQGELEYVLEGRKADSAAETGKVTADTQEIIYEYVPKQGGNVEVKYVIAGTETNLKDPVTLVTNG